MTATIDTPKSNQGKRAAASGFIGSLLEYYDFALFAAAAALIFPTVFFPGEASLIASFATFGVAYIARPVGALVLGHFGDRIGRKNVLIATLILMGAATVLIGALPGYTEIGTAAPIALVALRLVQGFAAGGEVAGASALTIEHAPPGRRGLFGSWTANGSIAGTMVATLVFIPVALLPDEILFTWGWRLPFFSGVIIFIVAFVIRRKLEDTQAIEEVKEAGQIAKLPIAAVLRDNWQGVIRVGLMNVFLILSTVTSVFGTALAIGFGYERTTVLLATSVATFVGICLYPFLANLSDRIGRKPLFIFGTTGAGFAVFGYFAIITTGSVPGLFAICILMSGLLQTCAAAVYPAFFAEVFSTRVRYTGMAIGLQLGAVAAGFAPLVGQLLQGGVAANWLPVAIMTAVGLWIAAGAAAAGKETAKLALSELGITKQVRRRMETETVAVHGSQI